MQKKLSIRIIVPWFGEWPLWMGYFLLSCESNQDFEWLLISDAEPPDLKSSNVLFQSMNLKEFSELASEKLKFPVSIHHPYKICDLRPAFGLIFEDFINNPDYWGYSDIDLIYGNLKNFLTDEVLCGHDIISTRKEYLSGHFCIYRNQPEINHLFKLSPLYKGVFMDSSKHYAFDERSNLFGKRLDRPATWLEKAHNKLIYKLKSEKLKHLADINEITHELSLKKEIRLFQKDMVRSDLWFRRHGTGNWVISWHNGTLSDEFNHQELLHFHFILGKQDPEFKIKLPLDRSSFRISPGGISPVRY